MVGWYAFGVARQYPSRHHRPQSSSGLGVRRSRRLQEEPTQLEAKAGTSARPQGKRSMEGSPEMRARVVTEGELPTEYVSMEDIRRDQRNRILHWSHIRDDADRRLHALREGTPPTSLNPGCGKCKFFGYVYNECFHPSNTKTYSWFSWFYGPSTSKQHINCASLNHYGQCPFFEKRHWWNR